MMAKTKKLPELRFTEFAEEWCEKKGEDLFSNSRVKGKDGLPIYSVTMHNGLVPRDSLERRMENDAATEDNLRAEPGDLVYNMMRMWQGAIGIAKTECMVSPAYVVLSQKKGTDPHFFEFYFKRSRPLYDLWAYSHGLTNDRLRLYFKDFGQIKFWVPTNQKEQRIIASFLNTCDEKIKKLCQKRELLEKYKNGLMQKIFSQSIRFKRDNGSSFAEWKEIEFGRLFSERSEKGYEGSELLSVKMAGGVVPRSDIEGKNSASEDRSNYKRVLPGDIAYNSMRMWQGASGMSTFEGIVSPAYTVITPNTNSSPLFFSYLFKYPPLVFTFRRFSQGLTSDTWNLKYPAFSKIKWRVPVDKVEQEKIAMALQLMDKKIFSLNENITALETFKKAMLQKLFV